MAHARFLYANGVLTGVTEDGRREDIPLSRLRGRFIERLMAAKGEVVDFATLTEYVWRGQPAPAYTALHELATKIRLLLSEHRLDDDAIDNEYGRGFRWAGRRADGERPIVISPEIQGALRRILDTHAHRGRAQELRMVLFGR